MYNETMDNFLPERVYKELTKEQLQEFDSAVEGVAERGVPKLSGLDFLYSENTAIKYLTMATPMKYSLIQMPHISEAELIELLEFDATRLDISHEMLWERDPRQGLWEQEFSTLMGALGNPNLSGETVDKFIQALVKSSPTPLDEAELLQVVGYQLTDKWSPEKFNAEVLLSLVTNFELYGVTEYLPKFKRLQRRAAKAH